MESGLYEPIDLAGVTNRSSAWLAIMTVDDSVSARCVAAERDAIAINGSSYVGVYGLEVSGNHSSRNVDASGISIYGNSHHVVVWKNHVHDFPGGGINCFDVDDQWGHGSHDMLDISFNTVHGTSRYSPSATSGISICASRDLTAGATWDGHYANRVVGNYVYDIENLVPYSRGALPYVTDGNAVSLDRLQSAHGYMKRVLVEGNLLVGCGGRAVHAYESLNVDGVGNTGIGNLRSKSPAMADACEFDGNMDTSISYYGNVIFPRNVPRWHDSSSAYSFNVVLGGAQSVGGTNLDRRALGYGYFDGSGKTRSSKWASALPASRPQERT